MTSITYNEQIIPLAKIINKNINNLTFKEIISLIFHAVGIVANDKSDPELATLKRGAEYLNDSQLTWKNIYDEFQKELEMQNKYKWPVMTIIKNDYSKRMDIFSNDEFIVSQNFLTLLLRILVVENYKRPYIYKSYNYHKILGHKLKISESHSIQKISLTDLFTYLKICLKYYIRIYNNDKYFEYQLAKAILNQMDE